MSALVYGLNCFTDIWKSHIATVIKVYLRIHGYKEWYRYIYSKTELDTVLTSIKKANADKKAIYLNNNHGMLENGLYLLKNVNL